MSVPDAWMLHKSGKYIPVDIHPYGTYEWKNIQNALHSSWYLYKWLGGYDGKKEISSADGTKICTFFEYLAIHFIKQNKIETKQDINKLSKSRFNVPDNLYSWLENEFDRLHDYSGILPNLPTVLEMLRAKFNQDFCRVRLGGIHMNGSDSAIYFRISSTGADWYNPIKNMLEDLMLFNKDKIDSLYIVREDTDTRETYHMVDGRGKDWYGDNPKDFLKSDRRSLEKKSYRSNTLLPHPYKNNDIKRDIADLIREGYSPLEIARDLSIFPMNVFRFIYDLIDYDIAHNQ